MKRKLQQKMAGVKSERFNLIVNCKKQQKMTGVKSKRFNPIVNGKKQEEMCKK